MDLQNLSEVIKGEARELPGEMDAGVFGDAFFGFTGTASRGISYAKNMAGAARGAYAAKGKKAGFQTGVALLSSVALAAFWVLQLCWMEEGTDNPFVQLTGWLTFARGGLERSALGFVGGILGKTMVASALAGILGGGFGSIAAGFKSFFGSVNLKNGTAGPTLAGAGISLMLYQAFTGDGSLAGAMAAVCGMLVSVRAMGSGAGIFYRILGALLPKKPNINKKTPVQNPALNALFTGFTLGFGLAISLALIPFEWTHLILGALFAVAGIVLSFVLKGTP